MLYQQGTQRIEVIVRKDGGDSGAIGAREKDNADASPNEQSKTWKSTVFGTEEPKRIKRIIITNATHTISTMKQFTNLYLDYWQSGLGFQNGDQAMQDRIGRQIEQITDVTNVASNVARGMVFGAWGGPIGMVMGGLLGAVSSGSSLFFKYAGRERDYNYKTFKMNNAIEYNRARAGINLTNGRLR